MEDEKWLKYAALIQSAIGEMFEEDSDYHVSVEQLSEGENLKHFIHALANVVSATIFNNLTGQENNFLEFNHIANALCFEFMSKEPE